MGMKIRKKWDLPLERRAALLVLAAAFLLGGGAACFLAALSGGAGGEELTAYLTGYLELAAEGELPRGLWSTLWGQLKYLLAAFVLGLTALGVAGLPIIFGIRGFFFAFPIACFCREGAAARLSALWPVRSSVGARTVFDGDLRLSFSTAAAAPEDWRGGERPAASDLLVSGRRLCVPDIGGGAAGVLGSSGPASRDGPHCTVTLFWEL